MATLSRENVETECPVCHENYIEPKILPCAHLLCRNCLVSWVKTSKEAHCPLCRSAIYDLKDSNSKTSEDLAEYLPTDHAMSAIVESYKIISQQQVCCVHTNTDAVSLCLHCSIMLCQSCVEYHHTLPTTSSHKTESLVTLTSERLAVFRQSPCSAHPNKTSKLFCSTHGVFICRLCASSKHRACQEVTDLNELLEKYKQSFAEMKDNLTEAESYLNETLTKFEDLVVRSEEDTKSAYTKIDSMCDDLILSVESCRNKLKKILKDSEQGLKTAVEDRKSYLARRIGLVTSHKLLLKRVQKTASSSVQMALASMIQNRVKDLTSVVSLPIDMKPMEIAKLNIDEKATTSVKSELEKMSHMTFISTIRNPFLQNAWMFHKNCGSNITLNSNRQTAEVIDTAKLFNRLVMSNEPMSSNNLYEIKVDEIVPRYDGDFSAVGVCKKSALSVPLPVNYYNMKTFVGVRTSKGIQHSWSYFITHHSCSALATVKEGSRLGVMVDTSHSLHVYVDGKDQGVVAKNVAQPCYAVFDLLYFLKKVCAFSFGKLIYSKMKYFRNYTSCVVSPVNYIKLLFSDPENRKNHPRPITRSLTRHKRRPALCWPQVVGWMMANVRLLHVI